MIMRDSVPHKAKNVILLGASNLTLAWPRIMRQLASRTSRAVNVLTAHGMGRSYVNARSGFAFRQLPGILHCPLWDQLDECSVDECVPCALITDLGNDLVYGRSPQDVAESTKESITRIRRWAPNAEVVVTRPPVVSVERLGFLRFVGFRTALFPKCGLSLEDVKRHTVELDERVAEIADEEGVPASKPADHWYGWDPIHYRFRHQSEAFGAMMNQWPSLNELVTTSIGPSHPRPTAAKRWLFGREKQTAQPVVTRGETRVFAY